MGQFRKRKEASVAGLGLSEDGRTPGEETQITRE